MMYEPSQRPGCISSSYVAFKPVEQLSASLITSPVTVGSMLYSQLASVMTVVFGGKVKVGACVSPPVKVTTAFVAKFIHSSSTSYSYTAVQLQSVPVTSESISVAVTVPQLSVYNAAILETVGAEGAFSIQTF